MTNNTNIPGKHKRQRKGKFSLPFIAPLISMVESHEILKRKSSILIDSIGRTDEVTTLTDEVTTSADEVTTSADEVTTSADEVTTSADEVTTLPDEVTTLPDQVTTLSDEVSTQLDEVSTFIEKIIYIGEKLKSLGERFKDTGAKNRKSKTGDFRNYINNIIHSSDNTELSIFIKQTNDYLHYSNNIIISQSNGDTAVAMIIIVSNFEGQAVSVLIFLILQIRKDIIFGDYISRGRIFDGVIDRYCGVPP